MMEDSVDEPQIMAWRNARMEYATAFEPGGARIDCEVTISGLDIIVSYKEDFRQVLYRGRDHGGGHFVLTNEERSGKATLHRVPDAERLEGFWREGGYHGWWFIELGPLYTPPPIES